jgi:hypothetical protein
VKLPPGYVSIDVYTWTRSVPEKATPDVDTWTRSVPEKATPDVDQRLFMDEIK